MTANFSITAGWLGIFVGFFSGMILGMVTTNDGAMGGYAAKRRRYVRLGHIACAALGMINILAGLCIQSGIPFPPVSQILLAAGLVSMPLSCFAAAIHPRFFYLFPIPVFTLLGGVITLLPALLCAK